MTPPLRICLPFRVSDIPDPGSRGFCVSLADSGQTGFVVHQGGAIYAYRNQCPHTGVALNWQANVFLDSQGELIQCAMHGALFAPKTGLCLWGPCRGRSLQRLDAVTDSAGRIYVEAGQKTL